jgi:hypothetical protein
MPAMYEASPPRVSCALAPGRVGCGRAPSSVCTRASLTRAAYDHAQTSDRRGGTMLCPTLRAGCVQPEGAWGSTGDPRTPAVGTSLDASTRVPSTCTCSDRARRESARGGDRDSTRAFPRGAWVVDHAVRFSRGASQDSVEPVAASTCDPTMCITSDSVMRPGARRGGW